MFILVLAGVLVVAGCSASTEKKQNPADSVGNHEDREGHNSIVQLSSAELKEFDIEITKAEPGKLETHVTLSGEIIIPPDNLAHIHPRFPGIVKQVYKNIGDHVKKSEALAEIESNESLTNYKIVSLISGTVIEMHLTRGEVVDDVKHGFTIANLRTVWAYLKVYQKDLPYVKKGSVVFISAGNDMPVVKSVVDYISPVIDEKTRTATARVVLDNRKKIWKPGLFVNGSVTTSVQTVNIRIPKTAIEEMNGGKIVFVKTAKGFIPTPVTIGRQNTYNVEILSGLDKGQLYVSKGGFTLKAQMQKSEFGDDEH